MPTPIENGIAAVQSWYEALLPLRGGLPAKGSLAIGLVILDRLREEFQPNIKSHLAPGGAQISGVSSQALTRILLEFGETRPFSKVAGRTNRGGPAVAEALLASVKAAGLGSLTDDERRQVLAAMMIYLVERVREFHSQERLKPVYDPSLSTRQFFTNLLALADETGKRGPVAQYLVGAKLQLRFPDANVRNESYSAADDQTGQPGDFVVGDTTFHVTVAPTPGHYEQCKRNLQQGRRVYLLVPDAFVIGARQNVEATSPGKVAVESIESFIAQNVEELSGFVRGDLVSGLRTLLERYNARVSEVELDTSMRIDIPLNLCRNEGDE